MDVPTGSASQNPCGWRGTRQRKGEDTLALVTAKRSISGKASTAALRPFCQRIFFPLRRVSSHPASGQKFTRNERGQSLRGLFTFQRWFCLQLSRLFLGDRILGPRGKSFVILESFLGEFDGFFELRVVACDDEIRTLGDNIIGINAVIFHDPFAAIVR